MTVAWIKNAPEIVDPGYLPNDDLRHWAEPGGKTRDSLFWQLMMPDHKLGFQCYLYLTNEGKTGFNLILWGIEKRPYVLEMVQGDVPADMDFNDFHFAGLRVWQPADQKTAKIAFESENVKLEYEFEGFHDQFSYRSNPDGLPDWFAKNRLEQSGWVKGFIEWDGNRVDFDRIGHRDHSWGTRHWQAPHHWKWLVAYTPDASRIVNAWIWMSKGAWGVGGYVIRDGELVPIASIDQQAVFDDDMKQRSITATITDIRGDTCALQMERFGLVKLPTGGRYATMIMEAACDAKIDGQEAAGQFECMWPVDYLDKMIELNLKTK